MERERAVEREFELQVRLLSLSLSLAHTHTHTHTHTSFGGMSVRGADEEGIAAGEGAEEAAGAGAGGATQGRLPATPFLCHVRS
eukprot:2458529-Rhodomonas_salina.1